MGRRVLALALSGVLLFACIGATIGEEPETDVEDIEDAAEPEEERAFLVIRKYIDEKEVVTGKNYTLNIDLYNAGSGPAFTVKLADSQLTAPFETLDGPTTATYERIASGQTVSFSYIIVADNSPLPSPYVRLQPAMAEYLPAGDATTPQVVYSTSPWLIVISPTEKRIQAALKAGTYVSGGLITSLDGWKYVGIVGVLLSLGLGGKAVVDAFQEARKQNQYKKALAEVEKMK
eukprot:jgi/Botrbrau1/18157/Bobra.53_1s0027.1